MVLGFPMVDKMVTTLFCFLTVQTRLDHFVYKENLFLFLKWSRLAKCSVLKLVQTIWKQNKKVAILFLDNEKTELQNVQYFYVLGIPMFGIQAPLYVVGF